MGEEESIGISLMLKGQVGQVMWQKRGDVWGQVGCKEWASL